MLTDCVPFIHGSSRAESGRCHTGYPSAGAVKEDGYLAEELLYMGYTKAKHLPFVVNCAVQMNLDA